MGPLHTFVDYRKWSLLTTLMALFCVPVDILIFYKEPIGIWGTLLAPLSFIPFCVMCADAMFPDKEVLVKGIGMKLAKRDFCDSVKSGTVLLLILDGKIRRILKNSWSKHLNLTYNRKYFYFLSLHS